MRKPIFLILFLIFSMNFTVVSAKPQNKPTKIYFNPKAFNQKHSYVTLDIIIDYAIDVYAFQVTLEFPNYWKYFKIIDVQEGTFFSLYDNWFLFDPHYKFTEFFEGKFTFASTLVGMPHGLNGSGVLARLTLEIASEGRYRIVISESILLNSTLQPIQHETGCCYSLPKRRY